MSFASLGLSDFLLSSIEGLGYDVATPVQEQAIPLALKGGDLLVAAQTGSGKTAAFSLPILQRFVEPSPPSTRVLVLVPTRELAAQVGESFERYGRDLPQPPGLAVVFGGVGYDAQVKAARCADIVVATPGRLIDLAEQGGVDLSEIEILVLDEADRLLGLGFSDELSKILDTLPEKRQNLLFSATFPESVVALADALLEDPEKIQIGAESRPVESVAHRAIEVERNVRTALLRHLLETEKWERVLVFVGSKRRADNVAVKLKKYGIRAAALHGDLSQFKRTLALEKFKEGKIQVLMATDVASRGIDIAGLPCVVNYDLPRSTADYVHRVGRTGRAGQQGVAVNFVSQEDDGHFKLIEKRNGILVQRERIEGFVPEVWNPDEPQVAVPSLPVKGKRKSKKDRLRATDRKSVRPWEGIKEQVEPAREAPAEKEESGEVDATSPWAKAAKKRT